MPHTAAIVLAAGASRRLGRPKQLLPLHGRPLLESVVAMAASWPVDMVVVVLGAFWEEIADAVQFGDAVVAVNEDWPEGIASSLRVGLDFVSRDPTYDRAFVVLGDQPSIPPDVPPGLLAAAEIGSRPALVPVYRYERANPVLFDRSLWARLMSLEGDMGASGILKAHPEWVKEVRFDHLPPHDVDTEADAAELDRHGGPGAPGPAATG
ncbi:MAG: hypothetical protein A2135_04895 [Actinobacteria bacterium RBG_16_67_15]|nr:MAG: hypothetical protein A2135_04895 [Actinobacteria bacterium RBG_16_67_15]